MKSKIQNAKTRLIVAASETDPDMLYATRFWAPDPFIFLERKGKRTLVLSDLEIDRGRKQADADEFVMFSKLEREVQGNSKKAPPYEKVVAHFLRKRGVRSAIVPAKSSAPSESQATPPTATRNSPSTASTPPAC